MSSHSQIDTIVLDFLIFPALGNGGAQSVDSGSANWQKFGFFAPQIFQGAHTNTHIGDKIFQNTTRRVAKFRGNRPMMLKNLWWEKKIKHSENITVFRYRWSDTRATVIR